MKAMHTRQTKLQQFRQARHKEQDFKKFYQAHAAFSMSKHALKEKDKKTT